MKTFIYGLIFAAIGLLSLLIDSDATASFLLLSVAVWLMFIEPPMEHYMQKKKRQKQEEIRRRRRHLQMLQKIQVDSISEEKASLRNGSQ